MDYENEKKYLQSALVILPLPIAKMQLWSLSERNSSSAFKGLINCLIKYDFVSIVKNY